MPPSWLRALEPTPREATRITGRIGIFTRRGWDREKAHAWAVALVQRDRERDERRLCIECSHLQRTGGCFAASQGWVPGMSRKFSSPITHVLQRCGTFDWQTP